MKKLPLAPWILGSALVALIPTTGHAGMRGYELAFADVSPTDTPQVGTRLAELLHQDMATAFANQDGPTEVTLLSRAEIGRLFTESCALTLKNPTTFKGSLAAQAQDGLFAYCYDQVRGEAVMAYLHPNGEESARIIFKLQPDGPMKGSLLRGQRRASLRALETAMAFEP